MAKFNFEKLNVSDGRTARLTMHQINLNGKTPFLVVKPATEATKGYYNAVLKRAGKSMRQVQAGVISAGLMDENRLDDRRLYPVHIITGWGYLEDNGMEVSGFMPDEDDKNTAFTPEACADFINALPNWLFDDLRQFCGNPSSFLDRDEVAVDAPAVGKSLPAS